jgi:c-di-GMP-binding flagellar brake protein YcgR
MVLKSLIFSHDEKLTRILKIMLAELSIEVEHVTEFEKAHNCLLQQKYDGVFAECGTENGANLLCAVRKSKHNKRSVVFALSEATIKMRFAFELGAHFVIHKPLVVEKVKRTLKAAHGLMMREQRAHFRHPTAIPVAVNSANGPSFTGSLRDLSQSGALLEGGGRLAKGQQLQLRFQLPETNISVEAFGRINWLDPAGRAGVQFDSLTEISQRALLQWVIERSSEPEAKVEHILAVKTEEPAEPRHEVPFDVEVEVLAPEPPEDNRLRRTLRAHHNSPIKVLAFSEGRPVVSQGMCHNVSEIGLSADLEDGLSVGDSVLTMINLPDLSRPMVLHAQVRHRDGNDHGFEFVSVPESVRSMLRVSLSELPVE